MADRNQQRSLYWSISFTLLFLLLGLGAGYMIITSLAARNYVQEINQQLYGGIAGQLVHEAQPLVNGQPDTAVTHDIMHSMMMINPSVEVYLLDTTGRIIDYVVPFSKVKLDRVDLQPVREFIANTDNPRFIKGNDPKQAGVQNVFSAAPILEDGHLTGYAYIILASEEQAAITARLGWHYIASLGGQLFYLILIAALLIGLFAFWRLTKNLRQIISVLKQFQSGDYAARISREDQGGLTVLGETFNEMAEKITYSIEQLKSVDRLRQELIANVSHDLRTPLAIIQGYVETLQMKDGQLTPTERQKYLNTVLDSSEKLAKLISQLFEYSKLEAQQIVPEKEAFLLQELCQDIIFKYQVLAREKAIDLRWGSPPDLPMVFADIGMVERVLQNLLDNAIKYSPNHGKVSLSLANTPEGVEVKVTDSGPGIPKEEQSAIFERHRQLDSRSAPGKGAGLGLAIVKKILEIHQSTIHVRSEPRQGAEFWFRLPASRENRA
jgi:signal transduction histidine kinase